MQALKTLIDKASEICGNDAALARRLKVSAAQVSQMRSGKRKVTAIQAAKLADIAGTSVDEALRAAVIEAARDTADEWIIEEIVGKGRRAGGPATLDFSYNGASIGSTETKSRTTKSVDQIHIVSRTHSRKQRLRQWLHTVLSWSGEIARQHRAPI